MRPTRTQTIELALPLQQAYDRCLEAATAIRQASLKSADEAKGTITLKVPMSVRSWGERVALKLTANGPDSTTVEVTSTASFPLSPIDYGKNEQNVDNVVNWLAGLPGASSIAAD